MMASGVPALPSAHVNVNPQHEGLFRLLRSSLAALQRARKDVEGVERLLREAVDQVVPRQDRKASQQEDDDSFSATALVNNPFVQHIDETNGHDRASVSDDNIESLEQQDRDAIEEIVRLEKEIQSLSNDQQTILVPTTKRRKISASSCIATGGSTANANAANTGPTTDGEARLDVDVSTPASSVAGDVQGPLDVRTAPSRGGSTGDQTTCEFQRKLLELRRVRQQELVARTQQQRLQQVMAMNSSVAGVSSTLASSQLSATPLVSATPAPKSTTTSKIMVALCAEFVDTGSCRNGNQCPYAHAPEQIPNYKSKLCKNHATGHCKYGLYCGFAHNEEEVILHGKTSSSSSSSSLVSAPNTGVPPVVNIPSLSAMSTLPLGVPSNEHHTINMLNGTMSTASLATSTAKNKYALCRQFSETGVCLDGARCAFAHSREEIRRFKSQLCKNFQGSGFCKFGDLCGFAHGEAELISYN